MAWTQTDLLHILEGVKAKSHERCHNHHSKVTKQLTFDDDKWTYSAGMPRDTITYTQVQWAWKACAKTITYIDKKHVDMDIDT